MTRVNVVQNGDQFTGEVTGSDKIPSPAGGLQDRYTVRREDNSTLVFVLPDSGDTIQEIGAPQAQQPSPNDALAHLAPTIGAPPGAMPTDPTVQVVGSMPQAPPAPAMPGGRPMVPLGSSVGGVPIGVPIQPVGPVAAAPVAPRPAPRPKPGRFMVQPKKGKATVFHTREDCSRVTEGAPRKEVDDEDITFFDLAVCTSCQRRDSQISWAEVIEGVLATSGAADPAAIAQAVVEALKGNGFRVTPEMVER